MSMFVENGLVSPIFTGAVAKGFKNLCLKGWYITVCESFAIIDRNLVPAVCQNSIFFCYSSINSKMSLGQKK